MFIVRSYVPWWIGVTESLDDGFKQLKSNLNFLVGRWCVQDFQHLSRPLGTHLHETNVNLA